MLTKLVDKATPKLYEAFRNGTEFATVVIHVVETDRETTYELKNVVITSFNREDDRPMEMLSLNFEKISVECRLSEPSAEAGPTAD